MSLCCYAGAQVHQMSLREHIKYNQQKCFLPFELPDMAEKAQNRSMALLQNTTAPIALRRKSNLGLTSVLRALPLKLGALIFSLLS